MLNIENRKNHLYLCRLRTEQFKCMLTTFTMYNILLNGILVLCFVSGSCHSINAVDEAVCINAYAGANGIMCLASLNSSLKMQSVCRWGCVYWREMTTHKHRPVLAAPKNYSKWARARIRLLKCYENHGAFYCWCKTTASSDYLFYVIPFYTDTTSSVFNSSCSLPQNIISKS